jgi:GT2 family glycosyltransferase
MSCGLVIPSLGGPWLTQCLDAVNRLDPDPDLVVVVLSGDRVAAMPPAERVEVIHSRRRLGFAEAVNRGIAALPEGIDEIALLNDDAVPEPGWLGALSAALAAEPGLAAVQGTVTDATGSTVDGRGITLDRWCLPVQVDRGAAAEPEPEGNDRLLAVSGTAALLRATALDQVSLAAGTIYDPAFGSYHEDLDLGLRLTRLGWASAWICRAGCRHLGSASATRLSWRHPWWLLANRWRAFAGNLTGRGLVRLLPRLLRGELRAVRTLMRDNLRALPVATAVTGLLPLVVWQGLHRRSAGARLDRLPGGAG